MNLKRIQTENKNFIHEVFKFQQVSTQQKNLNNCQQSATITDKHHQENSENTTTTNNNNLLQHLVTSDRIKTTDKTQIIESSFPIDYSLKKSDLNYITNKHQHQQQIAPVHLLNSKRKSTTDQQYRIRPNPYTINCAERNYSKSCPELGTTPQRTASSSFLLDNCRRLKKYNATNDELPPTQYLSNSCESSEEKTNGSNDKSNRIGQKRSLTWCLDSLIKQSFANEMMTNTTIVTNQSISPLPN